MAEVCDRVPSARFTTGLARLTAAPSIQTTSGRSIAKVTVSLPISAAIMVLTLTAELPCHACMRAWMSKLSPATVDCARVNSPAAWKL